MMRILRTMPGVTLPTYTWIILLGLIGGLVSACQTQSDSLALAGPGEQELTNSEVAEVLGLQQKAASIRYVRALKRLKEALAKLA